jgi:mitochondrial cardiolipin hydrolase
VTQPEIDRLLEPTLRDRRVSDAEKRALRAALAGLLDDPRLVDLIRSRALELAKRETTSPEGPALLEWFDEVTRLLRPPAQKAFAAESHFSPGGDIGARIEQLLRFTKRTCDVCVFTITDDRISEQLLAAHGRGVRLRVISDDIKQTDLGSDLPRFRDAGVPVRFDRKPDLHMHHKFAVFDNELLLTGSYNWTRGAEKNQENAIVTGEPRLVKAFAAEFDRLWDELKS